MARINRSDVIQKAVSDLGLSSSGDKVPNETLDKIQLTFDLNKKFSSHSIASSSSSTGTVTLTLPTIDPRSQIYLCGIDYGLIKDATCDVATSSLLVTCTPEAEGIAKSIVQVPVITLTAQTEHVSVDFAYPIRLKANTNMTYTGTFSVGVLVRALSARLFITSSN